MHKKKYEKILRRLCFAAACCLMLAGAAAPVTAFAAEDPADPGGSVDVLEGEWTLKPFVSVPDASYSLAIDYTVSGDFKGSSDVSVPVSGSFSSLFVIVGDSYVVSVGGLCVSSDPSLSEFDPSLTYPFDFRFYKEFGNGEIAYGGFAAPVTFDFGDGVVFDDPAFYQWFTSNAKPVGAPVDLEDIVTDSIRAPLSWVGSFLNALISGPLTPVFSVFAIAIAISLLFIIIVLIKRFVWGV